MGIECSEELDPCPEREPVGHHIRKVAGIHGGTILDGGLHARRCNCYRKIHVEASELGAGIINHKNDPWPEPVHERGKRHLRTDAPNEAIARSRPARCAERIGRAHRIESKAMKCVVVAGAVIERALQGRVDITRGEVGHDASIPERNHEADLESRRLTRALTEAVCNLLLGRSRKKRVGIGRIEIVLCGCGRGLAEGRVTDNADHDPLRHWHHPLDSGSPDAARIRKRLAERCRRAARIKAAEAAALTAAALTGEADGVSKTTPADISAAEPATLHSCVAACLRGRRLLRGRSLALPGRRCPLPRRRSLGGRRCPLCRRWRSLGSRRCPLCRRWRFRFGRQKRLR